jgi:hypothetical protein
MLRVHEKIALSTELVMVDAAGGVHKQRHRVYFLATPCAVGGLPLATIISDRERDTERRERKEAQDDLNARVSVLEMGQYANNLKQCITKMVFLNQIRNIKDIGEIEACPKGESNNIDMDAGLDLLVIGKDLRHSIDKRNLVAHPKIDDENLNAFLKRTFSAIESKHWVSGD